LASDEEELSESEIFEMPSDAWQLFDATDTLFKLNAFGRAAVVRFNLVRFPP
jgi:hypothetical protein